MLQCKVEGREKAIGETSCRNRQSIDTTRRGDATNDTGQEESHEMISP
jgi:hypothetical protein